jgi:hypothetical protein
LIKAVEREADRLGVKCRVEPTNHHVKLVISRCGRDLGYVVSGKTPGDHMAIQATISRVRRIAKGTEPRLTRA